MCGACGIGGSSSSVTHPCDHRCDINGERDQHRARNDDGQHGVREGHGAAPCAEGGQTRAFAVVTLAAEKPLLLNVPQERPVVTLSGKKLCDINKRLEMF